MSRRRRGQVPGGSTRSASLMIRYSQRATHSALPKSSPRAIANQVVEDVLDLAHGADARDRAGRRAVFLEDPRARGPVKSRKNLSSGS